MLNLGNIFRFVEDVVMAAVALVSMWGQNSAVYDGRTGDREALA